MNITKKIVLIYSLKVLGVAIAYYISGKLSLLLAIPPGYATAVWPAAGIALYASMMFGCKIWPGIFIGSFLVNIGTSFDTTSIETIIQSSAVPAAIAFGALLQTVVANFLIRRFVGFPIPSDRIFDIGKMMILGGPISCIISSFIGATSLLMANIITMQQFVTNLWTWWLGDSIGVVLIISILGTLQTELRHEQLRKRLYVYIPVLLSTLITIMLFVNVRNNEWKSIILDFGRRSENINQTLSKNMNIYIEILRSIEGLFSVYPDIDRDKFRIYVNPFFKAYDGIQALEWLPLISEKNRAKFEKKARNDGYKSFFIKELNDKGQMIPACSRKNYYPVYYLEPYDGNEEAFGFDPGSNQSRLNALITARDTGKAIASAKIKLVQGKEHQNGLLIIVPIYNQNPIKDNIVWRQQHLYGFALGVFKIADIMNIAMKTLDADGLSIRIYDATSPDNIDILYSNGMLTHADYALKDAAQCSDTLEDHCHISFNIGERKWIIHFNLTEAYLTKNPLWKAWTILTLGLLFTSLIGFFLMIIISRTSVVERIVLERTDELSALNKSLENEIHGRKLIEVSLRKNEARISTILEAMVDGVITIDEHGIIDSFNPSAERIFGYKAKETIGNNVNMLMPDHPSFIQRYVSTRIARLIGSCEELVGKHKNGSIFPIEVSINQMNIENQLMFVGIIRDITERKKIEEKLSKFQKAVEEAGHAIYMTDFEGNIYYANPAFEKITGYSIAEIIGKQSRVLKSGLMTKEYYDRLWKTILEGKTWDEEVINRKKNNELYYAKQTIAPITGDKGKIEGFVAIQSDISDRIKVEQELKQAKEQAESANRAKSEFLANMSHEIRTPMNSVIGFSELLSSLITDSTQKNYLEAIKTAGKSLLTLINDILDLSKIEAGKLELQYAYMDIQTIINEIEQIFRLKMSQKKLEFIIDVAKNLPPSLLLDETRIRQVLLNLVGNAVKFTDKGFIKLSVHYDREENNPKLDTLTLTISVQDTGIGIPEDQQNKIFESFKQQDSQSNKKYGGTGLGLSISKRLVEMMNGRILLNSTANVGSVFKVILKNIKIGSGGIKQCLSNESFDITEIEFEHARVLVVDDIELNRNLLREVLFRANLEVSEADDGKKAISMAQNFKPDIILMDIKMPIMDGYEAVEHLKNNPITRNIPVIALTASKIINEKEKMESAGFDGILFKPIDLKSLFKVMTQYLKYIKRSKTKVLESPIDVKDVIDDKDTFMTSLNNELIPAWKNLDKEAMEMDLIENFAIMTKTIATKHNAVSLVSYAQELIDSVNQFNVKNIETQLSKFSTIINNYK